jgi:beta-N-acetylhexosaminidase
MRGSRRLGISLLALSALLLAVVAAIPAHAAPRVAASPPAEGSKVILGETSVDGPALWTANPSGGKPSLLSVLAWTGTDPAHSLNILRSGDGLHYSQKFTFAESSDTRPAVAAQSASGTIVLAWTGTDPNHLLNLLCQGSACGSGASGEKKFTFSGDNSFASPALVPFGNGFLLAWAGTDPNHALNILPFSLTPSGSGFTLGRKTILGQFHSGAQPSLALNPQNNQLLLTWSATNPAEQIAFATSGDGVSWSGAQTLDEWSAAAPEGFAVAASGMPAYWLTWTGTDPAHSVNVRFTQSFPQWPLDNNKTTLDETALGGSALGYVGNVGQTLLAWTGTDPAHHLNLATISASTAPPTPTPTGTLDQRIDAYIARLSTAQKIGQTLMFAVYASGYNSNINQALTQWQIGNAIVFNQYNGGPLQPTTASGMQALVSALKSHAATPLLLALDEEGGTVDRLAPYYGGTPSARELAQSENYTTVYTQAQTDANRMRTLGFNVDFAPVADVDQGGGIGSSRTFGSSVSAVTTYAGAFLDGLQEHSVAGTLKHWPGLGAATGNPDITLPTINQTQAQMRAIDFAPFQNLLSRQPGMIMVTTVLAPAFDAHTPAMLSSTLVNTELRGQLGYSGVIVTDALDAQGLIIYMQQQGYSDPTAGLAEASVRAFLAGNDLIEAPIEQNRLAAVVTAMTQAVQSGRISQTQLNASVHRIIALKVRLGLLSV